MINMTEILKIYDKCPLCDNKLQPITDENDLLIDFWCNNCGICFDIDDLEYEDVTLIDGKYKSKNIMDYFK